MGIEGYKCEHFNTGGFLESSGDSIGRTEVGKEGASAYSQVSLRSL